MDVDLNFWKYQKGVYLDNQQVYVTACCEGEEIEGLELLPISEIMEKLKTTFSSWDFVAPDVFDGKEMGYFTIFTTSQIVRFDCCDMIQHDMDTLITVMSEFDCPFYDPLLSIRFDEKDERINEEFCFWKYREGVYLDNQQVYEVACCKGEQVEGLELLPISEIVESVRDTFSSWVLTAPNTFQSKGRGYFQITTTPQMVRVNCYGMSGYEMNFLMDVISAFDCPVYDSGMGTRFDGAS